MAATLRPFDLCSMAAVPAVIEETPAPVKGVCRKRSHVVGVCRRIIIAEHHVRAHSRLLRIGNRSRTDVCQVQWAVRGPRSWSAGIVRFRVRGDWSLRRGLVEWDVFLASGREAVHAGRTTARMAVVCVGARGRLRRLRILLRVRLDRMRLHVGRGCWYCRTRC